MITAEGKVLQRDRLTKQMAHILEFASTGKRTYPWLLERIQRVIDEPDPQREWREKWDHEFPGKGEEIMELIGPFYVPSGDTGTPILTLRPHYYSEIALQRHMYQCAGSVVAHITRVEYADPSVCQVDILESLGIKPFLVHECGDLVKMRMSSRQYGVAHPAWTSDIFTNIGWMSAAGSIQQYLHREFIQTLCGAVWSILGPDRTELRDPDGQRAEMQRLYHFILHELWLRGNFPLGVKRVNKENIFFVLAALPITPRVVGE